MTDVVWWIIIAVGFAFVELSVVSIFIFGPLAVCAVVSAIAAALGAGIEVQLAIFGIGGVISMFALHPVAKRFKNSPVELLNNADALVGKRARVLNEITPDTPGLIRLENDNWTARLLDEDASITPNSYVTVVKINGATAIVEPVQVNNTEDNK